MELMRSLCLMWKMGKASLDGVDGGTLRLMRMMGALRLMGEIGNSLLDVEDGERFA